MPGIDAMFWLQSIECLQLRMKRIRRSLSHSSKFARRFWCRFWCDESIRVAASGFFHWRQTCTHKWPNCNATGAGDGALESWVHFGHRTYADEDCTCNNNVPSPSTSGCSSMASCFNYPCTCQLPSFFPRKPLGLHCSLMPDLQCAHIVLEASQKKITGTR